MPSLLVLAIALTVAEAPGPEGSGRRVEVRSPVVGSASILKILSDGSKVREGETVAILDTSANRERLARQEAEVRRAEAEFEAASKSREAAEVAAGKVLDETDADLEAARGALALAEADRERVRDRSDWSKKRDRDGMLPPGQAVVDRLAIDRAEFEVERARTQIQVIESYTAPRRSAEAEAALEKALASELDGLGRVALERIKAESLERRVVEGVILAPATGTFRRARPEGAGTSVSGRQRIGVIEAD